MASKRQRKKNSKNSAIKSSVSKFWGGDINSVSMTQIYKMYRLQVKIKKSSRTTVEKKFGSSIPKNFAKQVGGVDGYEINIRQKLYADSDFYSELISEEGYDKASELMKNKYLNKRGRLDMRYSRAKRDKEKRFAKKYLPDNNTLI